MPITTIHPPVECAQRGGDESETSAVDGRDMPPSGAENCFTCERCDARTENVSKTISGDSVCEDCADARYQRCNRCDGLAESVHTTADLDEVCGPCAEFYYWNCDACSELIDSGEYCESCADHYPDPDAEELIYDYDHKPVPSFHGTGPLFLGVELEINTPWRGLARCAEIASTRLGDLGYLKEDSSIDHGFEIVTHPTSYTWAIQRFPWDLLADLAEEGATGEDAGLHVHISRDAFASPAHVYRWMKLLHRNRDQVIALARRESSPWAAFTESDRRNIKDYAKGARGERYRAINTQNPDTFELRIFASTLNRQEVQAALGLAAASVEYTRALSVADIAGCGGWDWSAFTAWVGEHPEYAPLSRELRECACAF